MIMTHGDNKGLIMPPRVAPIQVVMVPIFYKDKPNDELKKKAQEIIEELKSKGFRTHLDLRETHNPGFKYNDWEMKGVPLRIEFGPQDLEKGCVCLARRDTGTEIIVLKSHASQERKNSMSSTRTLPLELESSSRRSKKPCSRRRRRSEMRGSSR